MEAIKEGRYVIEAGTLAEALLRAAALLDGERRGERPPPQERDEER